MTDAAGNAAIRSTRNFVKDTVAPSGTIAINGGAATTTSPNVVLTLSSSDAAAMYITNVVGCTSGGTFENYATTKNWTLAQTSGVATVYAAFRDLAGNVGACVNDTIAYAVIAPLAINPATITLPTGSPQTVTFTASGGTSPYVFSVRSGDGTINAQTGVYTVAAGASGTTVVRVTDAAGRTAEAIITHTPQPPTSGVSLVFDGSVRAIGIDADGNRYFGGSFTRIGGHRAPGILALDAQGAVATEFDPAVGFDGPVHAVVYLADGSVVAGGDFATYRGLPARSIAHLSAQGELDLAFSPPSGKNGFDGPVYALAASGNSVYVGGSFRNYRGSGVAGLVKLSSTGQLDPVFNTTIQNPPCVDRSVYAIALRGNTLVIGGDFSAYRGAPARNLAKIDPVTGTLDPRFNPPSYSNGSDGDVRALALTATHVYAGGSFRRYRNSPANAIAKIALTGELDTGFNPPSGPNGFAPTGSVVQAIVVSDTAVYAGGTFRTYRGGRAENLAKIGLNGVLDTEFNSPSLAGASSSVFGLALGGDSLYAVGSFAFYRGIERGGLAKISADNGAPDPAFHPGGLGFSREGVVPAVHTIALRSDGARLVVGGDIVGSLYDGIPTGSLVKAKASGEVDAAFIAAVSVKGTVEAIAVSSRTIYVGGAFQSISGKPAKRIAKLSQAGVLDLTFSPPTGPNGFDAPVYALALASNAIYVGGDFKTYRGITSVRIARLSLGGALQSDFDCKEGFNAKVRALALSKDEKTLYAGGDFTKYGYLQAKHLAKISTANSALDVGFSPQSGVYSLNGPDTSVLALAIDPIDARLYVGGGFGQYRGKDTSRIIRVFADGRLDTSFAVEVDDEGKRCDFTAVDAIVVDPSGERIFFGGLFPEVNGVTVNHVTQVSKTGQVDTTFSPPNGPAGVNLTKGVFIPVRALAIDGNRLHIGGSFTGYRQKPVQNLVTVDFEGALN
jgi:hypothetical protein